MPSPLATSWANLDDQMRRYRLFVKSLATTPVVGSAVVKTTDPAIIGTPMVGVASTFTQTGVTGTTPLTRTQQWTLNGVNISGATGVSYIPVAGDETDALRVVETIDNAYGSPVVATSAAATVAAAPTTYLVGQVLYVNLDPGLVATIYIQRNGVDIPGAVSAAGVGSFQYTVVAGDNPSALTPRLAGIAWETDAPRRFSSSITVAAPNKIRYVFDENLDPTSVPATSDFAALSGTIATAKTATAVAITGNVVEVTYSSNFVPGDQPIASYTPGTNKLRDLAHTPNNVVGWTGLYIFNEFPVPATPCVLRSTEANYVVGGGGFLNRVANGYSAPAALAEFGDHGLLLDGDGWIEMQVADSNAAVRQINFGGNTINEATIAVRQASGAVRAYTLSTALGSAYTFASPSALCRVRIRRALPTGDFTMDTSEDGGVSWTTRYTFPNPSIEEAQVAGFYTASTTVAVIGAAVENFVDRGY